MTDSTGSTDSTVPAAPGTYAFLDTETTSLRNPFITRGRRTWEIALIIANARGIRSQWLIYPELHPGDLAVADPEAMRINRFYERAPQQGQPFPDDDDPHVMKVLSDRRSCAALLRTLLRPGITLVGCNPAFDADNLEWLLRNAGDLGPDDEPPWEHHRYDVTVGAATKAGMCPPYSSGAASKAIGVDRDDFAPRHTALADARWAEAQFLALYPDALSTFTA